MLARRGYSVAALRRALEKKFPAHPSIDPALARLRQLGYLDDRKYAFQVAASLARNRGFGPFRIRRELKARLVDYRFIEPALERAFTESDELELLDRAIQKKLRLLRPPFTPAKLRSLCQSLLRRGFRAGDIMKAVRAHPQLRAAGEDVQLGTLEGEEEALDRNSKW
jgi:regulatory protein